VDGLSRGPGLAVTVIGAGIVGVSCALHLQRRGHRVNLIDRAGPGEGTSFGNAGVLASSAVLPVAMPGILKAVPRMLLDPMEPLSLRFPYAAGMLPWLVRYISHATPEKVKAAAAAMATVVGGAVEEHQALAAGTGAERWIRDCPTLSVFPDEEAFAKDTFGWTLRRKYGVTVETYRGGEVREVEPSLRPEWRFAVALRGQGYVTDPLAYVRALAAHFAACGGTVLRRAVRDFEIGPAGPRRVFADGGEAVDTDLVVVACGAWSGPLAARLGSPVPLETERGYHVVLKRPAPLPRHPIMSAKGKFIATPMEPGLRVAGLVEFGGLEAAPNYRRARTLIRHAELLFDGLSYETHTEWMGHRPILPDSLPVIARSPRHPNVYFAFGHHHVGLTGGAKTGRLIADLVDGRAANVDLQPFRIDRF
jgi:D-amino-acid dehydrogenase